MTYKATFRWGTAFLIAGVIGILLFRSHRMTWERDFYLVDEPMRVVANRTVTRPFTVPVNAPYDINIYSDNKVAYADCLLGQGERRCDPYPKVLDLTWLIYDKGGDVLRKSDSIDACCSYTTDRRNKPVVYTTLGYFSLPAGTTAYVELEYRRDVSRLRSLSPRIVVERRDFEESEMGLEVWMLLGIGALLFMGLTLSLAAFTQYRASQGFTKPGAPQR